jgi:hypothetical protein
MEATDKIFIENNLCSIHDGIINKLIATEVLVIGRGNPDLAPVFEEMISSARKAKIKGTIMERRLLKYSSTIRSLGFVRAKDCEIIDIINNNLVIKHNYINIRKTEFEELEKLSFYAED